VLAELVPLGVVTSTLAARASIPFGAQ